MSGAATKRSLDALIEALDLAGVTLEGLQAKYEPAKKAADRAVSVQMRLYQEIKDMEEEIARLTRATEELGARPTPSPASPGGRA